MVATAKDDIDMINVAALGVQSEHILISGTILVHEILSLLFPESSNSQILLPLSPVKISTSF